jgi:hypothetical protein
MLNLGIATKSLKRPGDVTRVEQPQRKVTLLDLLDEVLPVTPKPEEGIPPNGA